MFDKCCQLDQFTNLSNVIIKYDQICNNLGRSWQKIQNKVGQKFHTQKKYMITDKSGERSVSKKEWEALKAELYAKYGMENVSTYYGDDFETGERDVVRGIDLTELGL